ncbi:MAG: hypothetical protein U0354_07095 [Candidatus Sericytochromatia bacterium]
MSISISFFFNSKNILSINDIANFLIKNMSLRFENIDSNTWICDFYSCHLTLADNHGFVNDMEIDFEKYKFMISLKIWSYNLHLYDLIINEMINLSVFLCLSFKLNGIFIYNTEQLLSHIELRDNNLIDLRTNKNLSILELINNIFLLLNQ